MVLSVLSGALAQMTCRIFLQWENGSNAVGNDLAQTMQQRHCRHYVTVKPSERFGGAAAKDLFLQTVALICVAVFQSAQLSGGNGSYLFNAILEDNIHG